MDVGDTDTYGKYNKRKFQKKGTDMKKNNNVAKVFLASLLKSVLYIILILAVGFGSYKISYAVLSNGSGEIGVSSSDISDIIEEAQTDEISKNLIYVYNGDKITHLMVEICNTKTSNMDYVTIPVKTNYTIPTTMYQKLYTINDDIPQIVRLGKLKQYFKDENDAYGYGELIIEKMLGIKISYYTAISQDVYANYCKEVRTKVSFKKQVEGEDGTPTTNNVTVSEKISVASDAYVNQLKDIAGNQEKIAEYIKNQYERMDSNLTVYNKIGYVEAYQKMNVQLFHYWGIPGEYTDGVFVVDTKASKTFLKSLINNDTTYTEVQDLTKTASASTGSAAKVSSSKNLAITVLNGSQITGLASATQTKLTDAGYTVKEIGDYKTETLTKTRIIVKKSGVGQDLVQYFNNPELVVGTVKDGCDIEIILGTADAN